MRRRTRCSELVVGAEFLDDAIRLRLEAPRAVVCDDDACPDHVCAPPRGLVLLDGMELHRVVLPRHPDGRQVAVGSREEPAVRPAQRRVPQHRWEPTAGVEIATPAFGG
jgi:hypothetical protein